MIAQDRSLRDLMIGTLRYPGMELIEIIVWFVVGFAPTLGGLELISRKLRLGEKIELRMNNTRKEDPDEHSF
jgi:hypothetical protein